MAGTLRRCCGGDRPAETGQAIIENYGEGLTRGVRTIVRGRWKLTSDSLGRCEMFDLESDPGEWTDLADDPAHAGKRAELEAALCADWGDPAQHDENRWQSEERRLAILKAWNGKRPDWQTDWRSLVPSA